MSEAAISQVVKLAEKGFRVIRADEFAHVIREWNGEGWNTIKKFKAGPEVRKRVRSEMTRMLRDPSTVRG